MIYDTFTFYNEFDVLEIRLHELAGVVDRFVLVEATKTHSGKPKPLYYRENRSRFAEFTDCIVHVVVDDLPDSNDAWTLENFQRNAIARGLANCCPDDAVLVSDVDEIPRASAVQEAVDRLRAQDGFVSRVCRQPLISGSGIRPLKHSVRRYHPFVWRFRQTLYYYFLNCLCVEPSYCYGTRMLLHRHFSSANEIRYSGYHTVPRGGWHFSYLGSAESIRQKIEAYAHQENNTPEYTDPQRIRERIAHGQWLFDGGRKLQFVPLDDAYPQYVQAHAADFQELIKK